MKTASFFTYIGAGRISIARFAPRDTPAGYRRYAKLAPGEWFNKVSTSEYMQRYGAQLAALDAKVVVAEIEALTVNPLTGKSVEPVLLCWEKPVDVVKDPTIFCHRAIVAAWLNDKLGMDVREIGYEGSPHPLEPKVTLPKGQLALGL